MVIFTSLLGAGVLGNSLGTLGHGVLNQFPRQQQAHSCLDLSGCAGTPELARTGEGSNETHLLYTGGGQGPREGQWLSRETSEAAAKLREEFKSSQLFSRDVPWE